jgi:ABC-type uncharacterized transport system involved in gliding motility auxiliary subunit
MSFISSWISTARSSLEEYRVARWAKGANRVAQIILSLALVAGLNVLASRHFERWDLTEGHRYSLSAETRAYLTNTYLEKNAHVSELEPIELILTLPSSQPDQKSAEQIAPMLAEMRELLREYKNAAQGAVGGPVQLKTEEVDTFKDSRRTEELTHEGLDAETVLLVRQGTRSRSLKISDLYEIKNQGEPVAVLGENAVTAAILDVIQTKPQKIYFTLGHGEMRLDDTNPDSGMTELRQALRQRNFAVSELDLTSGEGVPEDAAMVVIASPKIPFEAQEVEKLRSYLKQPHGPDQVTGRVMALLNPGENSGLEDLFYQWGILSDDALVIDPNATDEAMQGDMILGGYADHPITQFLLQNQLRVRFGPTRPVREDLAAPPDDRRRVTQLLGTTKDAWATRDYRTGDLQYHKGADLPGPVSVAALSEQQLLGAGQSPTGVDLPLAGGRLMVFGNADFIGNQRFDMLGNHYLFLNTVNYLLDRQNVLNIPPKPPFEFNLNLSRENLSGLAWRFMLPPLLLALLGFGVYLARRR